MWQKIKPYVISILIVLGVGGLSSFLTRNNMSVYETINRPAFAPPMILFPIVWSMLFILMGVSSAIVWQKREENPDDSASGITIYALQLIVNFFWTIIFFNMQAYLFAFIWLLLLLVLIVVMIIQFKKVSPLAAYMQIPYALWVAFAGFLTLMIYLLNR